MSIFVFLLCAALFFILTTPRSRLKKAISGFDPGEIPAEPFVGSKAEVQNPEKLELGQGTRWDPHGHPNPHMLILGGSGCGKSWTIRLLAEKLLARGYRSVLLDFHGDLALDGITSYRIGLDSEFGVNPLAVFPETSGGGPDPQRFEVLDQLRNAFRLGPLQLALVDECLKETYRRFGILQEDPKSWQNPMPHFGDLLSELDRRIKTEPTNSRARGLRTKLSPAFDFQIFNKPQIPYSFSNGSEEAQGIRLDLTRLPAPLQYMAADTFLKQALRTHQLAGIRPLSTYLLIDESKLCTPARKDTPFGALNRIVTEGRKFGLGLIVSYQFFGHVSRDILVNTFAKIVMRTDKTEIAATARRFRLEETVLESLKEPGQALVNFADTNQWKEVRIGSADEG